MDQIQLTSIYGNNIVLRKNQVEDEDYCEVVFNKDGYVFDKETYNKLKEFINS
ncbi:MAG: hypothetical protein ACTSWY_07260 [Promethearchaeota archaeon]